MTEVKKPAVAGLQRQTHPLRRILVVDDEPDFRHLKAEVLIRSGYEVDTAGDGKAGWETLHATRHSPGRFALLIIDYDMPGLTGLALIKKVHAERMAVPVIMATETSPSEEFMTLYPWLQPVATLIKPYSVEQFLETVEAALRTTDGASTQIASPPDPSPAGGWHL